MLRGAVVVYIQVFQTVGSDRIWRLIGFLLLKRSCDSFGSDCVCAEVRISTDCRIESQDNHVNTLERLRFQLNRQSIIDRLSLSPEGFGVSRGLYLRIGVCTSCLFLIIYSGKRLNTQRYELRSVS